MPDNQSILQGWLIAMWLTERTTQGHATKYAVYLNGDNLRISVGPVDQ